MDGPMVGLGPLPQLRRLLPEADGGGLRLAALRRQAFRSQESW